MTQILDGLRYYEKVSTKSGCCISDRVQLLRVHDCTGFERYIMSFFRTKYRIIEDKWNGKYYIQHKFWWLPLWITDETGFYSITDAKENLAVYLSEDRVVYELLQNKV